MSRRVYAAWRSAKIFLQGCQAGRSSWGLAEASISRPALERAQRGIRGYSYSSLEGRAEQADVKRSKEAHVYTEDTDSITSFIQSYCSANQKYPSIALVVRETGGVRKTVKKLLDDLKIGQSVSVVGSDAAEASLDGRDTEDIKLDCRDTEDIFSFTEIFRERGNQDCFDQEFLELLEQANSKENAIKKTAPLIEVLQQTASGSRRVHLSAWKGDTNLSWDNTLLSIMPSSINKKQKLISDDISSCTLSTSPEIGKDSNSKPISDDISSCSSEIGKDSNSTLTSFLSTSIEIRKDVHGTRHFQYGVALVAKNRETVLQKFSSPNLIAELKRTSKVFLDITDKVHRVQRKNVPIQAIIYFKTEKGMMDALKLKTLVIRGETLFIEGGDVVAVKEKSPEDLGAASLSNERSSSEKMQVSYLRAEGESLNDLAVKSVNSSKGSPLWEQISFQNTIMIDDYPTEVPLKSMYNFFSVFGALQIYYSKGPIFIKFKNECDKKKALNVHQFVVDECRFQIRTDVSSDELVIQLVPKRNGEDKAVAINACLKYGAIRYIQYHKTGVLTAHFRNFEKRRINQILKSLNEDKDLKAIWKPCVVCEGFKSCSREIPADDIKTLLKLSRELLNRLEKVYSDRDEYYTGES